MDKNWVTEVESDNMVQHHFSLKERLFKTQSKFQEIEVVETEAFGRMLFLDNCVMLTDTDEFVYHELITHIPVCHHEKPRRVAIIGGGDGGTVRELLRHQEIEEIILCDIDEEVVNVSRRYFPRIACGLDDPRVTIRIGDGVGYIKELHNELDLVLVDSTDPVGPGEGLFTSAFYQSVAQALRPNGIVAAQSESPWHPPAFLQRIQRNLHSAFSEVKPYVAPVPTYPRGFWSWTMAYNHQKGPLEFHADRFAKVQSELQYLNATIARNIFEIPVFAKKAFEAARTLER